MRVTVEIGEKEYFFDVPCPVDEVQQELDDLRIQYRNAKQKYEDRDLVVRAQDARIHELTEENKKQAATLEEYSTRVLTFRQLLNTAWDKLDTYAPKDAYGISTFLDTIKKELNK